MRGELDLVGAVVPVDNLRGHLKTRTIRGINHGITYLVGEGIFETVEKVNSLQHRSRPAN